MSLLPPHRLYVHYAQSNLDQEVVMFLCTVHEAMGINLDEESSRDTQSNEG